MSQPGDRFRLSTWVACLLFLGTAVAGAQESGSSQGKIQPGEVQTAASRVYVFVDKTGLGHQHGVEARLAPSTLALGAEQDAGQLVFDMRSFDADTPLARKYVGLSGTTAASTRDSVNANMRSPAVLDVERYPQAQYVVDAATATGRIDANGLPLYQLAGKFTLHGVTRPLKVIAAVEQVRGWLHLKGKFTIQQTDYGITPYSKAFGAIGVADALTIHGDLFVAPTNRIAMTDIPARQ